MSYCTVTDVQSLNTKRAAYSASTTPTLTQVNEFIDNISAEMDSILEGRGYVTPVDASTTSAKFVAWMLALNARGAASLAEQAQFPDRSGLTSAPGSSSMYWKQYREGLEFLKVGTIPGSDSGDPLPFSFFEQRGGEATEPYNANEWARPKLGMNREF